MSDDRPWYREHGVLTILLGRAPGPHSNSTVADRALRAGDRSTLVSGDTR